jgi:beta-lactam-binding protein with PASTA domain
MLETQSIVMPNVVGLDPVTAEELIEASELNVKIMVKPVISVAPVGTVGKTFPAAGEEVPRGTLIKVYISQGGSLVVPSVRGLSVADAKASLLLAGFAAVSEPQDSQFQYFQYSDDIPAGLVLGTIPEAGSPAEATGAILLIISRGPAG